MLLLRVLLLFALITPSLPVFAWSEFEHMLVADLALQKLPPSMRRQIEADAHDLLQQQETDRRLYLLRNFEGTSPLAQVSLFADTYRNTSIQDLYQQFGTSVPDEFAGQASEDTSTWHYQSRPFQPSSMFDPVTGQAADCPLEQETDIRWAIEQLRSAFRNADSEANRHLALALITHFVADAHQPLHAMTRVDDECESDRGGNRFCVEYREGGYSCEMNLHRFWDSSLGFFKSYETVDDAIDYVERVKLDPEQVENMDPETWLDEGYRQARFVYSLKDGDGADRYYREDGQIIAYERLALAAERLAAELKKLYGR